MRRDLLTLVCLIALLAWLTGQSRSPDRQKTPTPNPTVDLLELVPERHDALCARYQTAKVEFLTSQDAGQLARIERGEVVYLVLNLDGHLYPDCPPDLKSGKAVCPEGRWTPSPVAGKSWYCKTCHTFWGQHYPSYFCLYNHLGHP